MQKRHRAWAFAASALVLGGVAALTPPPAAADPPPWAGRWGDDDWDDDDDDYRRGYEDGRRAAERGYDDHWSEEDRYYDPRAHNGYYWRGDWHWGPPPRNRWRDCRPGYRRLQTGRRVPQGYVLAPIEDWRSYDLYAPGRGQYWARDERGEYFLLGLATGVIVDQILREW